MRGLYFVLDGVEFPFPDCLEPAFMLLDSSVPGKPHGQLDASTLEWLDAELASAPEKPALLFLHHPPFRAGIWHMEKPRSAGIDWISTTRPSISSKGWPAFIWRLR